MTCVLYKVDWNIPTLDDIARIKATTIGIVEVLTSGYSVAIITHWMHGGVPVSTEALCTPVQLLKLDVDVVFVDQYHDWEAARNILNSSSKPTLFIMQNTRLDPREYSENANERLELAQLYATLSRELIVDAFGVSHRVEATNTELTQLVNWKYGPRHKQECSQLNRFFDLPSPKVFVLGGGKLATKIPLLQSILPLVDIALIGGLAAIQLAHELPVELIKFAPKLRIANEFVPTQEHLDVELSVIARWKNELIQLNPSVILWNGPMGKYETPPFDQGTQAVAAMIRGLHNCFSIIAGGDTVACIEDLSGFGWVSTGGGAALEYIAKTANQTYLSTY